MTNSNSRTPLKQSWRTGSTLNKTSKYKTQLNYTQQITELDQNHDSELWNKTTLNLQIRLKPEFEKRSNEPRWWTQYTNSGIKTNWLSRLSSDSIKASATGIKNSARTTKTKQQLGPQLRTRCSVKLRERFSAGLGCWLGANDKKNEAKENRGEGYIAKMKTESFSQKKTKQGKG